MSARVPLGRRSICRPFQGCARAPGTVHEERRGPERRTTDERRRRLDLAAVRPGGLERGPAVPHGGVGSLLQRAPPLGAGRPLDAAVPPLSLKPPPGTAPR